MTVEEGVLAPESMIAASLSGFAQKVSETRRKWKVGKMPGKSA